MLIINQTGEPIEIGAIYDAVKVMQFKVNGKAEVGNPIIIRFEGKWDKKSWEQRKKKMPNRFSEGLSSEE